MFMNIKKNSINILIINIYIVYNIQYNTIYYYINILYIIYYYIYNYIYYITKMTKSQYLNCIFLSTILI